MEGFHNSFTFQTANGSVLLIYIFAYFRRSATILLFAIIARVILSH